MNEEERESQITSRRVKKIQYEKTEIQSDGGHESSIHSI